jgi:hypothetical protein
LAREEISKLEDLYLKLMEEIDEERKVARNNCRLYLDVESSYTEHKKATALLAEASEKQRET